MIDTLSDNLPKKSEKIGITANFFEFFYERKTCTQGKKPSCENNQAVICSFLAPFPIICGVADGLIPDLGSPQQ